MFSLDYWYYFDPQNWLIIESRNGSKYLINETGLDCFIILRNNAKHIDTIEELRSFIAANQQTNGIEELVNFLLSINFIVFEGSVVKPLFIHDANSIEIGNHTYDRLRSEALEFNFPEQLQIDIESLCNFSCKYCIRGGSKPYNPNLALKLDDLNSLFQDFEEMGGREVTFSGGEPYLREDFNNILLKTREYGFRISIFTNGSLLNDISIETLKYIRLNKLQVTLYGNKSDYLAFTGSDSHDDVVSVLDKLMEQKIEFEVTCPLTRLNKSSHQYFKSLEEKYKIVYIYLIDDPLFPEISPQIRNYSLDPGDEFLIANVSLPDPDSSYAGEPCAMGKSMVFVDIIGNVYPCYRYPIQVGNLHHSRLSQIWFNREIEAIRLTNRTIKPTICSICTFRGYCIRCVAYNLAYTGDMSILNESTCRNSRFLYQLSLGIESYKNGKK